MANDLLAGWIGLHQIKVFFRCVSISKQLTLVDVWVVEGRIWVLISAAAHWFLVAWPIVAWSSSSSSFVISNDSSGLEIRCVEGMANRNMTCAFLSVLPFCRYYWTLQRLLKIGSERSRFSFLSFTLLTRAPRQVRKQPFSSRNADRVPLSGPSVLSKY